MKWTDIVSSKSVEVIRQLHKSGPGAPPVKCGIPWISLDGHSKQILAIISNIPDTGECVVSFLDITSDTHAVEAVSESEERFASCNTRK